MAVKLRLRRMGKKKQPIYKIVAADSRSPRDGKFLEAVGLYNPLTNPHTVDLKVDRIEYWLDNGAQPTLTVKSLLRQKGITLERELKRRGFAEDRVKDEMEKWEKQQEASSKKKSVKKKKAEPVAQAEPAKEEPVKAEPAQEAPAKEEPVKEEPLKEEPKAEENTPEQAAE